MKLYEIWRLWIVDDKTGAHDPTDDYNNYPMTRYLSSYWFFREDVRSRNLVKIERKCRSLNRMSALNERFEIRLVCEES